MGFCQFGCDFSEFSKLLQIAPLGSPEKVGVISGETHVSFEIGSGFKNVAENK